MVCTQHILRIHIMLLKMEDLSRMKFLLLEYSNNSNTFLVVRNNRSDANNHRSTLAGCELLRKDNPPLSSLNYTCTSFV